MHHIDNLFRFNELNVNKKNTNFETMSISELKKNHSTFKKLISNKKLIDSLSDKGEKMKKQFNHIDKILKSRCANQSENEEVNREENEPKPAEDLNNIIDKMQVIQIEKEREDQKPVEKMIDENETKSQTEETTPEPSKKTNYFARPVKSTKIPPTLVNKANLNLDEVKEKVKKKLEEKNKSNRVAQTIPFEECINLLQQREKRVQEYQLEQTAKKLIEGQSVVYDYSFAAKAENLRYQERRNRNLNDDMLSDNESDDDDYNNDYEDYAFRLEDELGGDDASSVDCKPSQIDRLYRNKLNKNKFRPSDLDDLETID